MFILRPKHESCSLEKWKKAVLEELELSVWILSQNNALFNYSVSVIYTQFYFQIPAQIPSGKCSHHTQKTQGKNRYEPATTLTAIYIKYTIVFNMSLTSEKKKQNRRKIKINIVHEFGGYKETKNQQFKKVEKRIDTFYTNKKLTEFYFGNKEITGGNLTSRHK